MCYTPNILKSIAYMRYAQLTVLQTMNMLKNRFEVKRNKKLGDDVAIQEP